MTGDHKILKIRYVFILLGMLLSPMASAEVQMSIGIGLPNASIGIFVPAYPELVVVPGYPVYYAPQLEANYFFYDGEYWVYQYDNWYVSSWYDGPWWLVDPEDVPEFLLRVPVRYYLLPPTYFIYWSAHEPPHWNEHWGRDWEQHRRGWDKWDRSVRHKPAPLPDYQREYSGDRYPVQEKQRELQEQHYRYQPRDPVVRQLHQGQAIQRAPIQQEQHRSPEERRSRQQDIQRSSPQPQIDPVTPRLQSPQRGGEDAQRAVPGSQPQGRPETQDRRQPPQLEQREPRSESREPRMPESQGREVRQPPRLEQHIEQRELRGEPREQRMPESQGREIRQPGNDFTHEPRRGP